MSGPTTLGAYVPTTQIWDVSQLYDTDLKNPEALRELLVRMYQNLNNMALLLNLKDTGYYNVQEFVCSQMFFPNPAFNSSTAVYGAFRNVFRKVINFGALPAAGSKSVAHNIIVNVGTTFTRIYGVANNTTAFSYLPLPYVSATAMANNLELSVNNTNVTITTGGTDYSAYTITYVVLEYIKN